MQNPSLELADQDVPIVAEQLRERAEARAM